MFKPNNQQFTAAITSYLYMVQCTLQTTEFLLQFRHLIFLYDTPSLKMSIISVNMVSTQHSFNDEAKDRPRHRQHG